MLRPAGPALDGFRQRSQKTAHQIIPFWNILYFNYSILPLPIRCYLARPLGDNPTLRIANMSAYLDEIQQMHARIQGKDEWHAINPEYAVRMKLQNRFSTTLRMTRFPVRFHR